MLERLMSFEKEKIFFQDHWEKAPMILEACSDDGFSSLIRREDIDKILSSYDLEFFDVQVYGKEDFGIFYGLSEYEKKLEKFFN